MGVVFCFKKCYTIMEYAEAQPEGEDGYAMTAMSPNVRKETE